MKQEKSYSGLFNFEAKVSPLGALPVALGHVVAMIGGCVAPALMVIQATGVSPEDAVLLVQMALIGSALTTLLMLFPIKFIGSRLPMIYGVSFAYVPSIIALAAVYEPQVGAKGVIAIVFGAQILGGVASVLFGAALKQIFPLFPPLVAGTVVLCIGLSLYPVALTNMGGGGALIPGWGNWQSWLVGVLTLLVAIGLYHFGKGMWSMANVLVAMLVGYAISIPFGMVDFSAISSAGWFSLATPLHFGITFEPSAVISIVILFLVTAIEGIGDMTSTTIGGMNRVPTEKELQGGIIGYAVANIVGAFIGTLPTATYSQNAGIVSMNKVINRTVFAIAAFVLLAAGLLPKLSALLMTIPAPVIGGATLPVFSAIAMNGIRMITQQPLTARNTSIVGTAVAIGFGFTTVVSQAASAGITFMPQGLSTAIGASPVVLAALTAILMNQIIPATDADKEQPSEATAVLDTKAE